MDMNKMPTMPRLSKKSKTQTACVCGCGGMTGGTWVSGHDGRATGWAIRVERGILTLEEVPANERAGAVRMIEERKRKAARLSKKTA